MEVISESKPKARKQHRCSWCCGLIEKGEIYHNATMSNDGELYTWKEHDNCKKLTYDLDMWNQYTSDGLSSIDFDEHIDSFLQDRRVSLKNTTTYERTIMVRNILNLETK